jgi:hypothetical protein
MVSLRHLDKGKLDYYCTGSPGINNSIYHPSSVSPVESWNSSSQDVIDWMPRVHTAQPQRDVDDIQRLLSRNTTQRNQQNATIGAGIILECQ